MVEVAPAAIVSSTVEAEPEVVDLDELGPEIDLTAQARVDHGGGHESSDASDRVEVGASGSNPPMGAPPALTRRVRGAHLDSTRPIEHPTATDERLEPEVTDR